ncbi:MAG: hypothetical protein HY453_01820 [Parcubacteria group bacterium]|nr:hypothetical protein [Parcubacteria group bacterium]
MFFYVALLVKNKFWGPLANFASAKLFGSDQQVSGINVCKIKAGKNSRVIYNEVPNHFMVDTDAEEGATVIVTFARPVSVQNPVQMHQISVKENQEMKAENLEPFLNEKGNEKKVDSAGW